MNRLQRLRGRARELLDGVVSSRDLDLFELRLERWLPDLCEGLTLPYGEGPELEEVLDRLLSIMCARYSRRPEELKRLDLERQLRSDWFQDQRMIGYVCYTDRFAGSLKGVVEQLEYLSELGVTYLHLMPLLRPRQGENDGGYAVSDFRAVDPRLGTMDELELLAGRLRRRGMSLCIDLVINHVAREHEWAWRARGGDPRYQAYFWMYRDRTEPDRWEETLPEVFPDFSPGSFTFDDRSERWVWTTFNDYQWDLRWENPEVLLEFADMILDLANKGVEVFRLDAVAFIWKRVGTTCQNQPEVHALVQALRRVAKIATPAVAFKAEAIVAPRDLIHYLGRGAQNGNVSDLANHNSLMVQVWSSLASRDTRLMSHALSRFPNKPSTTAWGTYVRCHDDIGWAIADEDATAIGWEGPAHREFLAEYYSGAFSGSHAMGADFQANPKTGDRRTSGSAASLAGLEVALERDDESLRRLSIERLLLAHAVILSWDGIPLIYMGDELGTLNDRSYRDDPDLAEDNRWMHRPRMPWDRAARRFQPGTVEHAVFTGLCRLITARKTLSQLHASSPVVILGQENPRILVHCRPHPRGDLVAIHSFSEQPQAVSADVFWTRRIYRPKDRISGRSLDVGDDWLRVEPYARLWVTDEQK